MLILSEAADALGTITLNQPAKRNALSRALIEELLAALADFQKAEMSVIVLRAATDATSWSAGHDIGELPKRADPSQYSDPLEWRLRAGADYPGSVIAWPGLGRSDRPGAQLRSDHRRRNLFVRH